jgi:hypothetical protein
MMNQAGMTHHNQPLSKSPNKRNQKVRDSNASKVRDSKLSEELDSLMGSL